MGHPRIKKNCKYCGKEFLALLELQKRGGGNYCSMTCSNKDNPRGFKKGYKHSKETKEKLRRRNIEKGITVPKLTPEQEQRRRKSLSKSLKVAWKEGRVRIPSRKGIKLTPGQKEKALKNLTPFPKGKNHPNWKGNKTRDKHNNFIYQKWTKKIYKKDNYTCWICGKKGGRLNAHHLKSWSKHSKLRYKINNGLTLCEFCHKTYTEWGWHFGTNSKKL